MFKIHLSPTARRLAPLNIAIFLQGLPFWYATEKLFMMGIGFTTASIGLVVAVMSIVMLIIETPSGVLADRWSRKGVMILGCLALLISAVIGALSFNEPMYMLSVAFWGVYAAFGSGTYDSAIYDTVVEEQGTSKKFEYYLGKFRAIQGASFVLGALAGTVIVGTLDIRATYILSVPAIIVAFILLWKFREPLLHKAEVVEPVFTHIRQTFGVVLKRRVLLPIVIATVGFGILQEIVLDLGQLWFIAVAAPAVLFGIFNATIFSSWITGGLLAARVRSKLTMICLLGGILIGLFGLVVGQHFGWVLLAQFVVAICLIALGVILARKLHDELPSRLRAGASSVTSTLARILLIPGSILFTAVANSIGISQATYLLIGLAVISSVAVLFIPMTTAEDEVTTS